MQCQNRQIAAFIYTQEISLAPYSLVGGHTMIYFFYQSPIKINNSVRSVILEYIDINRFINHFVAEVMNIRDS